MTELNDHTSSHVVIVGGGIAALEVMLALRELADERLDITLVSPHDWLLDRPMTVAEPFGFGHAARYSLPEIAEDCAARFVRDAVTGVDAANRRVSRQDGPDIAYDTLILATGARASAPFTNAITFGLGDSAQAIGDMLDELRAGQARSVAFVAPTVRGWLLPLYELAVMTAGTLIAGNVQGVTLRLYSPEAGPLAMFGESLSQRLARFVGSMGIEFVGDWSAEVEGGSVTFPGESHPDHVVTLPLLSGPLMDGVHGSGPDGFIRADEYGRVEGLPGVYVAGDAADYPVKQGGLATQQADAVAEHVAASYGAALEPTPFAPVLRGMLFTGMEPLYMRSDVPGADPDVPAAWYPLWWPPTKLAGRYLAPYLLQRGEEEGLGGPPMRFVDVDIPLAQLTLPG